MKNIRHLLILSSSVILIFFSIVYSSCHKDQCKGVICLNGGKCSKGNCECTAGWAGDRCQFTTVTYFNRTPTPVNITISNVPKTIAVRDSFSYYGLPGTSVSGGAYATGPLNGDKWTGQKVTWDLMDTFPQTGIKKVDINVSKDYYFLKVQNLSKSKIVLERITSTEYEDIESVVIPIQRDTLSIGYFPSVFSPYISMYDSSGAMVAHTKLNILYSINRYTICGVY